jgi:biotin carboxylase
MGAERILLVMATTEYKADDFLEACRRAGVEAVIATDRCHVLDGYYTFPDGSLVIDFYELDAAVEEIVRVMRAHPPQAVLPAGGEAAAVLAARVAGRLGLAANPPEAAEAARNKLTMRQRLTRAGARQPRFFACDREDLPAEVAHRVGAELGWPCVIKPLLLSASRGVMRADDAVDLAQKLSRLSALLALPELAALDPRYGRTVLVEQFVPGGEVALEGILDGGRLRVLAMFDKPDPLDGPFFEETLYVTPSRLPDDAKEAVRSAAAQAALGLGLTTGPVHAELRLAPEGPVVIELAARSIGGLCSRMLRFGTGLSLEEVLVRHALGQDVAELEREAPASGAMMIPIPSAGVLKAVDGLDDALAVDGIEDVVISQEIGRDLVPLPEGASYLGFLFARGHHPEGVERALRRAHRALRFTIVPTLPT